MVLNLKSWSRRSEHFGNDMGWRGHGASEHPSGEAHSLADLASYRSRQHRLSGGPDISVHIDGPVYGPLRHFKGGGENANEFSLHHVVVKTETEVITEGDDYYPEKALSDSADDLHSRSI